MESCKEKTRQIGWILVEAFGIVDFGNGVSDEGYKLYGARERLEYF